MRKINFQNKKNNLIKIMTTFFKKYKKKILLHLIMFLKNQINKIKKKIGKQKILKMKQKQTMIFLVFKKHEIKKI